MKMLLVDDHAILREGLAALLRDEGLASEVLHAGSPEEGLGMALVHADLDAVLLDLRMKGGDGLEALGEFARLRPALPVIILSASERAEDARRAFDLGALGYVPKSASPDVLIAAVRLVMSGEIYRPPFMLREPAAEATVNGPLTARQAEVMAALARGLSNKEIALRFGMSDKTVKVHVSAILRALGVANRTQAVIAAQAAGVIPRASADGFA